MGEHDKAKAWREHRKLTVDQLAGLTGYGRRAIYWFERGQAAPNATRAKPVKVSAWVWQRYKMCCAGVESQFRGKTFDW